MKPVLAVVAQQLMVIAWSTASVRAKADENDKLHWSHGRYARSAEVELRNLRNHKFVTSNGWTERLRRPRPEVNVYSRIEEYPSPSPPTPSQPPATAATEAVALYRQLQHDSSFYQQQQQQPVVRTAKRIIYYATLPDVVRQPPPSPSRYQVDPYAAIGPAGGVPYTADIRQLHDSNRNRAPSDLQRNRQVQQSYGNAYTRDGGGRGSGGSVTSITTSKTAAAVYDSRYDEPAEFRGDQFYRPPSEFASKYPSWADPFYKSWTSSSPSSWGDRPSSPYGNIINNLQHNRFLGPSSFSPWDREPPLASGGNRFVGPSSSFSSWDREPLGNGLGDGGPWDNRGSSWDENRGVSPWDKELVEVPLKRPNGGNVDNNNNNNENYRPEVAVVHSGVIDVRGDRRSNDSPPPPPPPPRFTIVDVNPKPYHQRPQTVQPSPMRQDNDERNVQRYDEQPRQKPVRYEAYTPMEPPVRYEQQYRPLPPPSTRYGQPSQDNNNNKHHSSQYETIKNNINTHKFMTSWTEISSTQDDVSPTHAVSSNATSSTVNSNATSAQNNYKNATVVAVPYANTTKTTPN